MLKKLHLFLSLILAFFASNANALTITVDYPSAISSAYIEEGYTTYPVQIGEEINLKDYSRKGQQ